MMSPRRIDPGGLAAGLVWAGGAWAALGTLALTGEGSVARIGVLPPWWVLALLVGGILLLVALVRPGAREIAPLWVGALALLPWLPMPVPPAFLALAGPPGILLALAGLIGAGLGVAAARGHLVPFHASFALIHARRPWAAIGLAVALYCVAAWRLAPVLPGGDEPHYLIIAQSLLTDGDLRIENNHQRGDYRPYFDGALRPDYLRRGRDNEIYSIHAPGLAVLIAPAFAAGGYPAAVLLLALICAAGAALAGRAALAVTGEAGATLLAWTGVAFSAPFFFQAFTIFPDGAAAVLVMVAVWGLAQKRLPLAGPRLAVAAAALGALPWLHTRFAVLAGSLGLVYAIRVLVPPAGPRPFRPRLTDLVWLAAPAVLSVACWLVFFHAIYGVADPRAPYGHATDMRLARIPHGLAGLLLDQQFGLILNAPIYLLAFAGVPALWRLNPRLTGELTLALTPYVLAVAAHHMWWGGRSSPARFLVPVLLPAALPAAAWWASRATRTARRLALGLLAVSLALTATLTLGRDGLLLYNSRDGFALWLDAVAPAVNLAYALPSLFQTDPVGAVQRALVWAALLAAMWWGLRALERRGVGAALWWTAAIALGVVVMLAGASAGWGMGGRTGLEPGASQLALVARACDGTGTGVRPWPSAAAPPRTLIEGLAIADASRRPQARGAVFWFGRDLPPGRYRVGLETGLSATGTLNVSLGRRDAVIAQCTFANAPPGPSSCTLDLAAGAGALWLLPDAGLARTLEAISLRVIEPGAASVCGQRALRATANRAGTLYVTGGRAFVERSGLWTGGGASADLVATSHAPAESLGLIVRNGAVDNRVTVSGAGVDEAWTLAPGESRTVRMAGALVPGPLAPITVTSDSGFRPAEVDPASRDERFLGVWVEMGSRVGD